MTDSCIFCGKARKGWGRLELSCGGVDQPVCSDCAERYGMEPVLQRARLALDTGRAKEPERLTAFLETETRRRQEREHWRERASQCSVCGGTMERKLENFTIGADGRGGLISLLSDLYEVDLYACPVCGKVELYTAGFFQEEQPKPEEELVTCPACGTKHSPKIGCPTCAVQAAQAGRMPSRPARSGQKPPWER